MTRVTISHRWPSVFVDVDGHAGDHDVCTIISTVCNMIVMALPENVEPEIYSDGRVRIIRDAAERKLIDVVMTAEDVFRELQDRYPDCIKVI